MDNHGWTRALDTQMDLLKWHLTDLGQAFTMNFFNNVLSKGKNHGATYEATPEQIKHDTHTLERNVREMLWRGDTMYVTTDMQHIMLQAAHDLPDAYRFDIREILCPMGFCLFEETIYGVDISGVTLGICGLSWYQILHGDTRAMIVSFWSPTQDPDDKSTWEFVKLLEKDGFPIPPLSLCHYYVLSDGATVRPGKELNNMQGTELVDGMLSLFAALNILSHQTIGEPIKMPPPRSTRRRIARDFTNSPERMITLITLRRKSAKKQHDPDAPPVPWSRRWMVGGHWRRQPDKNGWHWTYIYEYIKGPEDKPLIIRERRVFNFRR